jgi:hypothetical protein
MKKKGLQEFIATPGTHLSQASAILQTVSFRFKATCCNISNVNALLRKKFKRYFLPSGLSKYRCICFWDKAGLHIPTKHIWNKTNNYKIYQKFSFSKYWDSIIIVVHLRVEIPDPKCKAKQED